MVASSHLRLIFVRPALCLALALGYAGGALAQHTNAPGESHKAARTDSTHQVESSPDFTFSDHEAAAPDSTHQDTAHHTAGHAADTHAPGHDAAHGEKFEVSHLLFHHVLETHHWHLFDWPTGLDANGKRTYAPVALHLPYIVYDSRHGLRMFSLHGHSHEEVNAEAATLGYRIDTYDRIHAAEAGVTLLDFSITKSVLQMLMVLVVLILVFTAVKRTMVRNEGRKPRGIQRFFEPIIVFIRDEIAKPNMHGKHMRFLPYLLTLFFFIWFCNMFGLFPFNSNITGNISVTVALAVLTFILVQFNGTRDYWQHIFWYPGMPIYVKLIMMPVEIVGMFSKPFSLTIRLFANIVAGHFMVLSLVSLIFIFNELFQGGLPVLGGGILSVGFTLIIMLLETLVAVIQAYVFTLLTAIFIGQALESHHGHAHDHAHSADHAHA